MSNYLFDLIAKSFNLIDTVQPLVLSVFEPLPEANLDWEQLITIESTELETTSQTDRFSNPEILESLEWRSPTTNLQISEEITNPFLTNLSSTPVQSSQQILKSISNLVRKSDLELSSNRSFSESVLTQISTENQQLASNIEQKKSITLPTFIPVLSGKQPTKINPVVSFVQSANIDNRQLASNTEQKPTTTPLTFAPVFPDKQPTKINPVVSFVESVNINNQQLALNTEQKPTTTPLTFAPVLSEKQPNTINLEPFHAQPFLESKTFSTNLNQILPHPNTQILKSVFLPQTKTFLSNRLISVQNTESNTSLSNPISKQRQLTPKFLLQQPIEINHLDLSLQIPFNENSTKSVIFPFAPQEKTFSQPNLNTTIFRTAIAKENNARISNLVAEKSGELTTQFLNKQSLEISRIVSLHHLPKVLNFKETSTILSIPNVIQQGKSTTENLHKQSRDINPVFTHSQLPLVESSEAFPSQLQSELTVIPLVSFANAPTITKLSPLTPALAVETNTPTFSAFQPQEQLITESSQKRLLQIGNISSSKILSSQIVEQPTAILLVSFANTSAITQESPLTPVLAVETITPISTTIQPQQQLTNEFPQNQTLQTPNILNSEILSSQIVEQPTAIPPLSFANTSAITQESPLTPVLAVETITPISTTIQPQQQLTNEFPQKRLLQTPNILNSEILSSQIVEQPTAIPPLSFANTSAITQESPLKPVLAVETITPISTAIQPQQQLTSKLPQNQTLQTPNISSSEILSSQIVEQLTAILPVSFANTSAITQESPLKPVLVVETITPISTVIQPQQQLTSKLPQNQTLQTPNISSSEILSSQIVEQLTAILPVSFANTSAITQESPLKPVLVVETITPISTVIQPQQQLTNEFPQKQTLQTPNILSIQVQQLMGSQLSIPEKSADNVPVPNQILPTNQKTLTLGLTVETSTPVLNSVIFHQEQPASELTKQQSREIMGNVLSSQVQKLISPQLDSSEILEEPVAIPTLREPLQRTISSANAYILDWTLSNSHKQSLVPKIITETKATLLHSTVEPQEKLTPDLPKIQQRFVHKNVASIQPFLTDASAKIPSFHTNSSALPFLDNLPSSAINSDIAPTTVLNSSNVGTDIQPRVNFSESHLSDFRREKVSAQEIGSQNYNQNYRKHIPIEKFGVAQRWGELGKREGEMNVSYAHHPENMQLHNINSNEAMLTNPVENLILPQNAPPNFSMSADRSKDGVESSDFRQLEESDLISSSDSHLLLKFLPVSLNDKSSPEHDIRPLSEPINDLTVKNLSVIARSSKKLQKRSPLVDAPPAIQVTIGRLEVRSAAPAPPPPRPKPRPAPSVMSLNEYLQRRARRG